MRTLTPQERARAARILRDARAERLAHERELAEHPEPQEDSSGTDDDR